MKKILILAALAVLPLALGAAVSANATAAPVRGATLSVSTADAGGALLTPEPSVGSSLVFSGCGYTAGVGVSVTVQSPSAMSFFGAMAGSDGCFSTASTQTYIAQDAGSYQASSYQSSKRRAAASVSFTVVP